MYAKVNQEGIAVYPYTIEQMYADNPDTSFPSSPSANTLGEFGVVIVEPTPKPAGDHTVNISEGVPALVNGAYTQTWLTADASSEEISERVQAQWASVRYQRTGLLNASDWTQLPDSPVDTSAWANYRANLRDITLQDNPFSIVWPSQPA